MGLIPRGSAHEWSSKRRQTVNRWRVTVCTYPRVENCRDCRVGNIVSMLQGITVNAFQAKRLFLSLSKLIFYPYHSCSFPLHVVWATLDVCISLSLFLTSALVLFNRKNVSAEAQAHVCGSNQKHLSPTLKHPPNGVNNCPDTRHLGVTTTSGFTTKCRTYALLLMVYG